MHMIKSISAVFIIIVLLSSLSSVEAQSTYQKYVVLAWTDSADTTTNKGASTSIVTEIPQSMHSDANRVSFWVGLYFGGCTTCGDFLQVGYKIWESSPSGAYWFWQAWHCSGGCQSNPFDWGDQASGDMGPDGSTHLYYFKQTSGYTYEIRVDGTFIDSLTLSHQTAQNDEMHDAAEITADSSMTAANSYFSEVKFTEGMHYWDGGTFRVIDKAGAYYATVPSGGGSSVCPPNGIKGKNQDSSLGYNVIRLGNNVGCTSSGSVLWDVP